MIRAAAARTVVTDAPAPPRTAPVYVVGHGFGALVALRFAQLYSGNVALGIRGVATTAICASVPDLMLRFAGTVTAFARMLDVRLPP